VLVVWLVGDHLLLSNFGPYGIFMNACVVITVAAVMLRNFGPYGMFMNACVVITVAVVMSLKNFGPYGVIFIIMCLLFLILRSFLTGKLLCLINFHDFTINCSHL
jgi:hypothetical protein